MNDSTPETLREKAEFVTGIIGADGKTADAMTRLMNSIRAGHPMQAEFDALQDAADDAMGRPRHKHLHPTVWRIRYWWHWHITAPIIYPLMDVPGHIATAIRKVAGRKLTWLRLDADGHLLLEEKTWYEVRRQRRQIQAQGGEQQ